MSDMKERGDRRIPKIEIHRDEEWAALYIDGVLDRVGDAYLADERIYELFGIEVVQDDAFMRGQTARHGVAQTLDEVYAYRDGRERRRALANEKRQEAARLQEEAAKLER